MIRSLFSSISSFKSPTFRSGLNILVAEKDETNDQKKTRNSAGKTSLVEIIHFVLGASLDEKSIFRYPELAKARFGIDFDIRGKPVKAVRSVENHGQIVIQDGDTSQWPIEPSLDRTSGERIMPLKDWTSVLGWGMFNLPTLSTADGKGRPSFRNLFPYFARRARDAGFHDPTLWGKGVQQADAKRIALSFLLGLDWTIAQRLKQISDQLEHIEVLSRAAKSEGVLSRVMGSDAEVLRELAITEARAKKLEEEVRDFRVIPEYEVLRKEGDQINRRQGDIEGEEMSDSANLAELEEALKSESVQTPNLDSLDRLYREAQVVLPQIVTQRFEEVRAFHESVVRNRKMYLEGEITAIRGRIDQRKSERSRFAIRYQEIMRVLQAGGALEQYHRLQEELNRVQSIAEHLRKRHQTYEDIERQKTEFTIQKKQLGLRLAQDFHEQEESIKLAMATFEEFSSALYHHAGSLLIQRKDSGPDFTAKIPGSRGGGIGNMAIFCFDLMLTKLLHEQTIGPGFLVHDSHLFDPVDSRQVSSALELGAKTAAALGIQYIVLLNTNDIPSVEDRPAGFDIEQYINPIRLKDTLETGGLFGFRFGE